LLRCLKICFQLHYLTISHKEIAEKSLFKK
jgi:hypothetical protein